MNYQTRANAYRENSVIGMSREDTVPLMYEHLLVGLKRASKQIQEKDYEGKAASVEKASAILYELLASLNFEEGGEVASRLASLYTYFLQELTEASRKLEAKRLDPLIEMVTSLHEAWVEAAEKIKNQGHESEAPTSGEWE